MTNEELNPINLPTADEPGQAEPGFVYGHKRPFQTAVPKALSPLPAGAVEPQGWLRDRCLAARDGYTGHMDDMHEDFRRAWAVDYTMKGERLSRWELGSWPYFDCNRFPHGERAGG